MKIKIFLLLLGILCALLFIGFTFLVRADLLRQFDFAMTVKIQDKLPVRSYRLFSLISPIGRFEIISILLFIILILARQWWQMFVVFAAFIGAHVLELVGKLILYQPPPPFRFYKIDSQFWFPDNYSPEGNSYPSGHSLRAIFLAVVLSMLVYKSTKIPFVIKVGFIGGVFMFAGATALAKVALGQHWATDVIAGVILGFGASSFSAAFLKKV